MFNILKSIKNLFIHIRSTLKVALLVVIASIIIIAIISCFYTPVYSVTLNGEFLGYTSNKSGLQEKINEYMEKDIENNIAFVDVSVLPEYSLCFVKKGSETNDDEIFAKVTNLGTTYYEYFAILEDDEEKYYVATKEQAEEIINELKDKNSNNIDELAYTQLYGTEIKDFAETETVVDDLYEKKVTYYSGSVTYTIASAKVDISQYGINLIQPVSGLITSRFGYRSSGMHTGLDIAAPTGTTISAAAAGTVEYVSTGGSGYGMYIIINHGNNVKTLYGHCSALYVTEGQYVAQGESIAAVGSTGNSTGSHLHLEVRVDGTTLDPQYYVY